MKKKLTVASIDAFQTPDLMQNILKFSSVRDLVKMERTSKNFQKQIADQFAQRFEKENGFMSSLKLSNAEKRRMLVEDAVNFHKRSELKIIIGSGNRKIEVPRILENAKAFTLPQDWLEVFQDESAKIKVWFLRKFHGFWNGLCSGVLDKPEQFDDEVEERNALIVNFDNGSVQHLVCIRRNLNTNKLSFRIECWGGPNDDMLGFEDIWEFCAII